MSLVTRALGRLADAAVQTRSIVRPVSYATSGVGTDVLQLTPTAKRWTNSAIAYRCISAISTNASSLDLQVIRPDGAAVENHWLTRLWAAPNQLMSGRVFGEILWQRLETRGEMFVYLDRGESGTGEPRSMWPIFGQVTVFVDKNLAGEIVGYEVEVGSKRVPLLATEVLWLRYPDSENEWGNIAPLTAAAHAIGLDAYARAWQKGELKNGARPSAIVYLGDLDEDQHASAVAQFRNRIEGPHNAGRAMFVSSAEPAKVERLSLSASELGWLDTRSTAWEEMTVGFGVPKDYLLGGATYENRAAARSTLWSDTIIGKLEVVAGEIARQLLPPAERARFDTDDVEALKESADAKVKRAVDAHAVDLTTIDEARSEIGLEPLGGGMGAMTLTAYRALLQLEAQSLLLSIDPGARQLPPLPVGPLKAVERTSPLALPTPANVRMGMGYDEAQAEYDLHEKLGAKAVRRLAGRQEAVVLQNLHKLFGRSGAWAAKRAELTQIIETMQQVQRGELDDPDGLLPVALRAKVDDLLDDEWGRQQTRADLESFLSTVWSRGGSTTASALGVDWNTFELDVLTKMDERLDVLAGQVTATTRQVLEDRVLLAGVANGEDVDQLAARVRATFTDLSTWRAVMIARTETVGGFNASSRETARSTGLVKARVWLATGDKRTRDSHVNISGETLTDFDQRYSNGCLHPGDATAPPAETIMCRCVETFEV